MTTNTAARNESRSQLIDWLDANGWTVCEISGRTWTLVETVRPSSTVEIEVTLHNDGRMADYEIRRCRK